MSLVTHPMVMWVRGALRSAGLTRPIALLFLGGKGYEEPVDTALFDAIKIGDVVWDVGANVGLYTVKFANAVGSAGHVCAFEPSPLNLGRLHAACLGYDNITIHSVGLSAEPGRLAFAQGEDELGATSKLVRSTGTGNTIEVSIKRGDDLVANHEAPCPNVVKIDVEGHEHKVLAGLTETLRNPLLRTLIIEVHFRLLKENDAADAPKEIEQTLSRNGFKVRWVDASHICATRVPTAR